MSERQVYAVSAIMETSTAVRRTFGFRTSLVVASSQDEACGCFVRRLCDDNPEATVSNPAAILVTHEKIDALLAEDAST